MKDVIMFAILWYLILIVDFEFPFFEFVLMEERKEILIQHSLNNSKDGFPLHSNNESKFGKLTRDRVLQLMEIHTYNLKIVLFIQFILIIGGTLIEIFYPRWYLVITVIFGFFSIFFGIFGLIKKIIIFMQIYSVLEALGVVFSFVGTILIYIIIINYNSFCKHYNNNSSENIEEEIVTECVPRDILIISSVCAPLLFIILLFGLIYGFKIIKYLKLLILFSELDRDKIDYKAIAKHEQTELNYVINE